MGRISHAISGPGCVSCFLCSPSLLLRTPSPPPEWWLVLHQGNRTRKNPPPLWPKRKKKPQVSYRAYLWQRTILVNYGSLYWCKSYSGFRMQLLKEYVNGTSSYSLEKRTTVLIMNDNYVIHRLSFRFNHINDLTPFRIPLTTSSHNNSNPLKSKIIQKFLTT